MENTSQGDCDNGADEDEDGQQLGDRVEDASQGDCDDNDEDG